MMALEPFADYSIAAGKVVDWLICSGDDSSPDALNAEMNPKIWKVNCCFSIGHACCRLSIPTSASSVYQYSFPLSGNMVPKFGGAVRDQNPAEHAWAFLRAMLNDTVVLIRQSGPISKDENKEVVAAIDHVMECIGTMEGNALFPKDTESSKKKK